MKKIILITALVVSPLALSACDKQPEAPKVEAPMPAAAADAMTNMAMPEGSKMDKGNGTVTAINAAAGKITIDHGAIPAVDWPAMKMGFSAKPEMLKGVAVGDKVDFDVTVTGSAGEVTAIQKK